MNTYGADNTQKTVLATGAYYFEFHGLIQTLFSSLLYFQNFDVSFGSLQAYHTKKPSNGVAFVQLRI